jgi:DNA-directed RNA polymerase specialized sigma24 family protein
MHTTFSPHGEADGVRPLLRAARSALYSFRSQIAAAVLDELAQEAVTRGLGSAAVRQPQAFVRRVAHHLAVDQLRRQRREDLVDPEDLDGRDDGWSRVDAGLDLERVWGTVLSAPAGHRRMLLAIVEETPVDELVRQDAAFRGVDLRDLAERDRLRDAIYKRRDRAVLWLRERLGRPSRPTLAH